MSVNALAEAVRQGKEVLCGSGTFNDSGALAIPTQFAIVDAVIATVNSATAPDTAQVTYAVSDNVVTLYAWEATDADTTTLTASDAEEDVSYVIVGRRR